MSECTLMTDCSCRVCNLQAQLSSAQQAIAQKEKEIQRLRKYSQALLDRMQEVYKTDQYIAVWQIAQAHFGPYTGETWVYATEKLKDALTTTSTSAVVPWEVVETVINALKDYEKNLYDGPENLTYSKYEELSAESYKALKAIQAYAPKVNQ